MQYTKLAIQQVLSTLYIITLLSLLLKILKIFNTNSEDNQQARVTGTAVMDLS